MISEANNQTTSSRLKPQHIVLCLPATCTQSCQTTVIQQLSFLPNCPKSLSLGNRQGSISTEINVHGYELECYAKVLKPSISFQCLNFLGKCLTGTLKISGLISSRYQASAGGGGSGRIHAWILSQAQNLTMRAIQKASHTIWSPFQVPKLQFCNSGKHICQKMTSALNCQRICIA